MELFKIWEMVIEITTIICECQLFMAVFEKDITTV